jgi:hypothetical protein
MSTLQKRRIGYIIDDDWAYLEWEVTICGRTSDMVPLLGAVFLETLHHYWAGVDRNQSAGGHGGSMDPIDMLQGALWCLLVNSPKHILLWGRKVLTTSLNAT